jgi:hypothetical protein
MSENELDTLLNDWATRHELSQTRMEAIRAIRNPTTSALPKQWWKELFRGISVSLRESTDPRPLLMPVQNS